MTTYQNPLPERTRIRELDWLMLAVAGLCCLGLVMAVSIQSMDRGGDVLLALKSQGSKLILGVLTFIGCATVPLHLVRRNSVPIFLLAAAAVWAATLFGTESHKAHRWLSIAGYSFQPVDPARVALIVVTAALIGGAGDRIREFGRGLCVVFAPVLLLSAALFLQPDNGNALLCLAIVTCMAVTSGVGIRWLVLGGAVAIPAAAFVIGRHGYVLERVTRWLSEDPPYQVKQGLIAMQSGGFAGSGIGHGWRKMGFVPEPQNDFVFTIIGEELGFLGSIVVLASFMLVGVVTYRLARRLSDPFHRYVVFGCGFALCAQAVINMLVTTGLAPAKGIDLPFVSAGGTNLVTSLGVVGLIGNAVRADGCSAREADQRLGGS
ncbi:MAG: FtsW/RodA/SpoVE family cell cycle protein [Planctomycetota bacterium]